MWSWTNSLWAKYGEFQINSSNRKFQLRGKPSCFNIKSKLVKKIALDEINDILKHSESKKVETLQGKFKHHAEKLEYAFKDNLCGFVTSTRISVEGKQNGKFFNSKHF